ncbi:hypothetical protein QYF36_010184 [Acer negundo]|nr:hypothetical protein QYF36_010184 [Acer negundo]
MDFYEQHAYDEESEAMNELVMKLIDIVETYEFSDDFSSVASEDEETGDEEEETIKEFFMQPNQQTMKEYFMQHPEQASKKTIQAIKDSYPDFSWSYNEVNTYEQLISQPSQKSESEEFPNQIEQEEAIAVPYYVQEELSSRELDELLDWVQDIFGDDEEVEKEETKEKVKEAEDVPFEALLLYKELKPYVPPITFLSRLHKSNWNKWFFELISSHFIVNIYLSLLIVCRNMPVREKFFQDLIAYRRKFETLEYG